LQEKKGKTLSALRGKELRQLGHNLELAKNGTNRTKRGENQKKEKG